MNFVAFHPNSTAGLKRRFGTADIYRSRASATQKSWRPAVDIVERDEQFELFADLPGVDPAEIAISTEKNVLTIAGERRATPRDEADKAQVSERYSGSFERRFTLPEDADTAAIEARSEHGTLIVTIPKAAAAQPRRIAVTAAAD